MFSTFIIIKMVFGGMYSSCLYLLFLSWYKKRSQKEIKASAEAGEDGRVHVENIKRDAFVGYVDVISRKINAFSGNMVGAYCIRPKNVLSMERITWKRDTFLSSIEYEYPKRGAFSDY